MLEEQLNGIDKASLAGVNLGRSELAREIAGEVPGYIDLHAHILPGFDDGCRTLEESLEVAQVAIEHGVQAIVASPHTLNGKYKVSRDAVRRSVEQLQQVLDEREMPLRILPGCELYFCSDPLARVDAGQALTIGDSRILILELPTYQFPQILPVLLLRLVKQDVIPLIVHPERNRRIQEDPALFADLVRIGARGLLVAGAVLGTFGRHAKACAERLLELNCYHGLASDAHGESRRPYEFAAAIRWLEENAS